MDQQSSSGLAQWCNPEGPPRKEGQHLDPLTEESLTSQALGVVPARPLAPAPGHCMSLPSPCGTEPRSKQGHHRIVIEVCRHYRIFFPHREGMSNVSDPFYTSSGRNPVLRSAYPGPKLNVALLCRGVVRHGIFSFLCSVCLPSLSNSAFSSIFIHDQHSSSQI